jgi:hypothetical protein
MKHSSAADERLLYRRQFFLGPAIRGVPIGWQEVRISSDLTLRTHPDLEVVHVSADLVSVTLLGIVVDPLRPHLDQEAICRELLSLGDDRAAIFRQLEGLGGRFIFMFVSQTQRWLVGDLTNSRPIFFVRDCSGRCWCASDPKRLADILGLELDEDVNRFLMSSFFQKGREPWFPGEKTRYMGVRRLLPNHYLDLASASILRYWPTDRLTIAPLHEAAAQSATLLQGMMRAAMARYPLAFAITAGMDSRTALAATHDYKAKDMVFYTGSMSGLPTDNSDVTIPATLLPRYGYQHEALDCSSPADPEFLELYTRNVTCARLERARGIYWTYKRFGGENRVVVHNGMSEVAKCFYGSSVRRRLTGGSLARLSHMGGNEYAIGQFSQWLEDAKTVCDVTGMGILDLFYWEQRAGSWGGMCHAEADIAHDTFLPFNCRSLITSMLSVEEKYRLQPYNELHRCVIAHLWPDLLDTPINPLDLKGKVRLLAKILVQRFVQRFM